MTNIKNDLILRTIKGEVVERPPVWLMRQAGRILPQYRAVRASLSGFIELVTTPERVAEVTVQPVDELGVDAAILFSDILVIPEAMGLPYTMEEKKGPAFPNVIQSKADIDRLISGAAAAEKLEYVYEGLRQTKVALDNRVPLIGFAGAPFTLLAYMVEGQGSKTFSKAKKFMYTEPVLAHLLLSKITDTVVSYLEQKVANGANIIQIFDSWAGMLDEAMYKEFCIPYLTQIVERLDGKVPVTIFAKGAWFSLAAIKGTNCQVIGLDWHTSASYARATLGANTVVQGNLDPCVLYSNSDTIETKVTEMIRSFGPNYIVNLGHGVYPDTPLDGVKAMVEAVKSFRY